MRSISEDSMRRVAYQATLEIFFYFQNAHKLLLLYLAFIIIAGHKRFLSVSRLLTDIFSLLVELPHARLDIFGTDRGVGRIVPVLAKRAALVVFCVEILHIRLLLKNFHP